MVELLNLPFQKQQEKKIEQNTILTSLSSLESQTKLSKTLTPAKSC